VCGFDVADDARATMLALLLDLPRDYRLALAAPDDAVRARRDDHGWTAIEYTAHSAEVLHSTLKRLVFVLEEHERRVSPPQLEAVRAAARTSSTEMVLASFTAACRDLGRLVSVVLEDAWNRTALGDDGRITARDILADSLHEAFHHSLDARRASGVSADPGALAGIRPA
jgi:hypothetical protein